MTCDEIIRGMVEENHRRKEENQRFSPLSGENSPGIRVPVDVADPFLGAGRYYFTRSLLATEPGRMLSRDGDLKRFADSKGLSREEAAMLFRVVRLRHDFAYWCSLFGMIRPKRGGANTPLVLNRAQRHLTSRLENMREAGQPIRVILLKARQWGGSTVIQLYMVWLQMTLRKGLNSLTLAHQNAATEEIRAMMRRVVEALPEWLVTADFDLLEQGERDGVSIPLSAIRLEPLEGEEAGKGASALKSVGRSGSAFHLPARNCDFKTGTAERPDGSRGGSYSLVHLSEVGIWRSSEGRDPAEIVISATSGVLAEAGTMIVLESTAKGRGNYFHHEYEAAVKGEAQWCPVFVAWHRIEQYSHEVPDPEAMARRLYEARHDTAASARSESGAYLWRLWESGATLEAIAWYEWERRKYDSSAAMASEYPSDDIEAFCRYGTPAFSDADIALMSSPPVSLPLICHDFYSEEIIVVRPGSRELDITGALSLLRVGNDGRISTILDRTLPPDPRTQSHVIRDLALDYPEAHLLITAIPDNCHEPGHARYLESLTRHGDAPFYPLRDRRGSCLVMADAVTLTMLTDNMTDLIRSGRYRDTSPAVTAAATTLTLAPTGGYTLTGTDGDSLLLTRLTALGALAHIL